MARSNLAPPGWAEVALSVYDLRGAQTLNSATSLVGLGGIYHVGIEVYWLEWSYGWTNSGTGVYAGKVGQSWQGSFRERIALGRTPCKPGEVISILNDLRRLWQGGQYHPLRRNCGHFSAELASRLHVGEIPTWVNSFAGIGDWLSQSLGASAGPFAEQPGPSDWWMSFGSLARPEEEDHNEHHGRKGREVVHHDCDRRLDRQWYQAKEHIELCANTLHR